MPSKAKSTQDATAEQIEALAIKLQCANSSLDMYQDIFDCLYDEVHIWKLIRHPDGEIKTCQLIDANTATLSKWGKKKHEVVLKTSDEIFPTANTASPLMSIVKKIFTDNLPYQWEHICEHTGQTLLMKNTPVGEYFISTGLDISELKQTQNDLHSANLRLTEATKAGKVGIWDWFIQKDAMTWDDQMYLIYGVERSENKRNITLWEDALHPEDAQRAKQAVMDTINHGIDYNITFRIVLPDGGIRHIKGDGVLLKDQKGNAMRMLGTNRDITDRLEAESALKRITNELKVFASEKQAIFDAIIDSVIVINERGVIEDCNEATLKLFAYTRSELIGRKVNMLMEQTIGEEHDSYLHAHLETGTTNIIGKGREVLARKKSGDLFYAFLSVAKYCDGKMTQFVGTLKDIDEAVKQRIELEFDAVHDPLTKLPTRRLFEQTAELAVSQSLRQAKTFFLLFIDLNKFKPINDTFGHDVGDKVLQQVSQRLLYTLRLSDFCARLGGDEFVVLCEPSKTEWDISELLKEIENHIAEPIKIEGHSHSISASIGVAQFPTDGQSVSELLKCADKRMYEQKVSSATKSSSHEKELVAMTYLSHSLIPDERIKQVCQVIEKLASKKNAEKKVSGILFFCRNRFIQRLEGPKTAVDELVEKIKQDPRHRNFSLVSYNFISKRSFTDWSHMAVHHEANTFAQLDNFLLNIELNASKTLNEQEALFIVNFIKRFASDNTPPHKHLFR